MTMTRILLSSIRVDGGTQARAAIDESVVAEYAEAIGSGVEFPPVVVFNDGSNVWLADGFHRVLGSNRAGAKDINADVRLGTLRDAILYAAGANAHHGLRRTNADKRRSVLMLLEDPDGEWSEWSDRKIADLCGVGHPMVAALRDAHVAEKQRQARIASAARKVESDSTPAAPEAPAAGAPAAPKVESDSTQPTRATAPDTSEQVPGPVKRIEPPPADSVEPPPADEDDGPDEAELAALAKAEADEQAALQRLLDSDDKLATVHAENKQLRAEVRVLRERLGGMQNKSDEQIRIITALRGKLKKLEQPA